MRLLLDTHAAYWWMTGDAALSPAAAAAIADPANELASSAVSIYEIGNKVRIGRLPSLTAQEFLRLIRELTGEPRPLTAETCLLASTLPWGHRDPWDRVLAAEASMGLMTLVSADAVFDQLPLSRLW